MFHFLLDPWHAPYMRRALIEMGVLAILAGTVSVYVLLRRLAFIGDALTHSVFPGVVVAFVLGESLFLGALVAGVVAALLLTAVTRSRRIDDDAASRWRESSEACAAGFETVIGAAGVGLIQPVQVRLAIRRATY